MKIYSFPTFNLTKILMVAEELNEPYQLTMLDITKGEHKSEAHVNRHPLGKVPAVEIDGEYYFESNAICRFIAERNDNKLYGNTPAERARTNQWLDMATAHIGRWLTAVFFEKTIKPLYFNAEADLAVVAEAETFLNQQLPAFEAQLSKSDYIASNEFTIADIITFSYFTTTELSGFDLSAYPNITQWIDKIKARASYSKAKANLPS